MLPGLRPAAWWDRAICHTTLAGTLREFFLRENFIVFPVIVYSMTQVILPAQDQELPGRRGKVTKTTIQISPHAKDYLDKIKEQAGVETYDQAILFLIRERRKHLPSSFGKLPGIGHFTREEDDSHRVRH